METATTAVPKTYIAEWIKLDFFNTSNLKAEIQNRISAHTKTNFINALNNIKGDNKGGCGVSLSEITLLALAYFYSEIFTDKIKEDYYSIEMVKGFLDGNNLTDYTPIHEIDVKFYKLNDTPYFKHCWLIIQTAWFFNSEYFGHHQHIDYLNHYITTGQKLPIDKYNFDRNYLEKKYNDITPSKLNKLPINGFTLVSQWYYSILFLVCKELQLPTTHFNILIKDNREYNPLPKTSRQLRPLTPFKVIECDIKSAFPTFLDALTGAKQKDHVYNNLMKSKNISRSEAKIMFNTICNSREYKTKNFTADFFISCGYLLEHITMLLYYTHNDHLKFFQFMTRREEKAIETFVNQNHLERGARLHDALLFIDTKTKAEYYNLKVSPNCDFGFKALNKPIYKESFSLSDKRLPYAYIGSIPQNLNLIRTYESSKSGIKGLANGFIFYTEKYKYISAVFNINDFKADYSTFIFRIETMFTTLHLLNRKAIKPEHVYLILQHIREHGQYVFNVKALCFRVMKFQYLPCLVIDKERDYNIIEPMIFKKNIDFLKARNEAEKIVNVNVNYNELFCLLQERIINNDYGFLNENKIIGHKRNNLLVFSIVKQFNLLCSGTYYKPRKTNVCNLFINNTIKRLQTFEISEGNHLKAQQLFLILCSVAGKDTDLKIIKNDEIQNELKLELIQDILKLEINNIDAGVNCFDFEYKPKTSNKMIFNTDIENIFDTDLKNSVFNHISIEEAYYKGEVFLKEYYQFHGIVEVTEISTPLKTKDIYKFPKLDFDLFNNKEVRNVI